MMDRGVRRNASSNPLRVIGCRAAGCMLLLMAGVVGSAVAQDRGGSLHPAGTAVIDTLQELGPALGACWRAPEGSSGSQITVMFSLNRKGAVIGKPRISFSHLLGSPEAQQTFVAAALASLAQCTPLHLSDGLGNAIAGRPFSIRFIGGPEGRAT